MKPCRKIINSLCLCVATLSAGILQSAVSGQQGSVSAAAFSAGDLLVCRVGDGLSVLGNTATPVFLDEFTPAGVFVRSIALPTSISGFNRRLTVSGTSNTECQITRSADGQYVVLAGYNAPPGTANLAASLSTVNARVIGRIDALGNVDTTTALPDALSGGSVRGAASTNGTDLWVSGNGLGRNVSGISYAAIGSMTSTALMPTSRDTRAVNIFGGQLFASSGQGAPTRTFSIAAIGSGTPTTAGQTLTTLSGIPVTISVNSFFFADLSPAVAGFDTLYAADDVAGAIRKYSFDGTSWVTNGTVPLSGVTGLTGIVDGTAVTLFVTNPSSLQSITDTSGFDAAITGTLSAIASPPDHTEFRSVAFAPVAVSTVSVNWGLRRFTRIVTVTAANTGPGVKRIYFKVPYAGEFRFVEGNSARFKVIGLRLKWSFQAFVEDNAGNRSAVVTYTTL